MANVKVAVPVAATPEAAWRTASNLSLFDRWLVLHDSWRSEIPTELGPTTRFTSVVVVKGMRNRIDWAVTSCNPPAELRLSGNGKGGVNVTLVLSIRPDGAGALLGIDADFSVPGMIGPLGSAVARSLKGEIATSVERLSRLIAADGSG